MAEKKWFGLAAAAAAIGGLAVLVKNKVKESPETFSAAYDTTKEKTKQAAQRVTGMFGDSRGERRQRRGMIESASASIVKLAGSVTRSN